MSNNILEIKSGLATKEFTLDYDPQKEKYYLNICAYGQLTTETFFNEYALKEYLRDNWNFEYEQIRELLNKKNIIGLSTEDEQKTVSKIDVLSICEKLCVLAGEMYDEKTDLVNASYKLDEINSELIALCGLPIDDIKVK